MIGDMRRVRRVAASVILGERSIAVSFPPSRRSQTSVVRHSVPAPDLEDPDAGPDVELLDDQPKSLIHPADTLAASLLMGSPRRPSAARRAPVAVDAARRVGSREDPMMTGDADSWWLDERGHAGREHFDERHARRYDAKMDAQAAEEIRLLQDAGVLGPGCMVVDLGARSGQFRAGRRRGLQAGGHGGRLASDADLHVAASSALLVVTRCVSGSG